MKRLLFFSISLFLCGCAKERSSLVNQSAIFTTYRANYDDEQGRISSSATFNFGGSAGTYLELDGDSTVEFDQKRMDKTENIIHQVIYEQLLSHLPHSEIWGTHTFMYRNNDGLVYTNSFTFPSLVATNYPGASVSKMSSFTAQWSSLEKMSQDSLSMEFIRSDGGVHSFYSEGSISQKTSGTITASSESLTKLGSGDYVVRFCRQRWGTSLSNPGEGGFLSISSCTRHTNLTITD